MARIENIEGLEAIVGKKPPALDLKVVDHIDPASQLWLSYATVMLATLGGPQGPKMLAGGGAAGFAHGSGGTLRIPHQNLDDAQAIQPGSAFGSLWLVPGMKETLRINGTVSGVSADAVTVDVLECYLHCAKALLRSNFWQAAPSPIVPSDPAAVARASCLMALGQLFEVEGKVPKLAIEVITKDWSTKPSAALKNATLWPAPPPPEALKPAKIFAEHMRLSKQKSLSARMAKAAVSVPGLVRRSLESDYEKNLY